MLPYIILNGLVSVFPHLKNFSFLITDGVILSQLTSIYLYNEFSMTALLTIMPVLFVLQNHMLVHGIFSFVSDEHEQKLTFVRLIGRHDAVFLFVIYALFIAIFTSVDLFSTGDLHFAANFWYVPYALYAFAKLMDHKQSSSKIFWALSLLSVFTFIGVYLYTIKHHV
jgi:1,4-dihydroxy-2-naphthoate octaprenyltransferase